MPQSYYLNRYKLHVADFNSFADDINDIVGIGAHDSGYGQSHLVVTKANANVTAPLWDELLTSMLYAGRHQGTTLNSPTSTTHASWSPLHDPAYPSPPDNIITTITTDIANIVGNKLNSDISYMTVSANKISTSETYYDPSGTPSTPIWTSANQVYYEAKVAFADEDNRRHFFNSGGELRFDATLTGVDAAHAQSVDWQTMLGAIQTIKLSHSSTESSASVGTPGYGFNMLTGTYQLVYTKGGTGDYAGNQINIYAKLSGTTSIDIKLSFDDVHPSDTGTWSTPPYSGNWTGTDYVAGTLTVTLDELRATDTPDGVTLTSPTYSHISQL
tara:strand:- start:748 stop:1734 length:987 start_codon:yes stop_codon:yes gene_type:complete